MKIAKKYYVDKDDNMIGYTRYRKTDRIERPAELFHTKLKICSIGWLNSGVCFTLEDENGRLYNMNDVMLREYIKQKDVFLEGDWNFYQQGSSFSIGLQK